MSGDEDETIPRVDDCQPSTVEETSGWGRRIRALLLGDAELVERYRTLRPLGRGGSGEELEHPNIPPVHDVAAGDDGDVFFTMKRVRGQTLQHLMREVAVGGAHPWSPRPRQRTCVRDTNRDGMPATYAEARPPCARSRSRPYRSRSPRPNAATAYGSSTAQASIRTARSASRAARRNL